jgi:ubiquinone/menaquinone biosynthesis C-methylase UbiE
MSSTYPHDHSHGNTAQMAQHLDLDAEVFGAYLDEAITRIEHHAAPAPRRVVDIGSGTGVGSLAIARRFPASRVIAIDSSAEMIERLRSVAETDGLTHQVSTVQADLDATWPEIGRIDLAWASSSLHHLADPDRVLRDVYSALAPGGLFIVIETDSGPQFLPDAVSGLERRLHSLMGAAGWNAYPDWTPHLEHAGFVLVEKLTLVTESTSPTASHYARLYLSRVRAGLADRLTSSDRVMLDQFLANDENFGPNRITASNSRTAWIARRPAAGIRSESHHPPRAQGDPE